MTIPSTGLGFSCGPNFGIIPLFITALERPFLAIYDHQPLDLLAYRVGESLVEAVGEVTQSCKKLLIELK